VSYSVDEISRWRLYFICTYQSLKHRKNSRKKIKAEYFFFTILTLASFWEEIRRGFSVSGGVDR